MLRSYIWVMRTPGGRNMPLAIIFSDIMTQIMFSIKILSFLQHMSIYYHSERYKLSIHSFLEQVLPHKYFCAQYLVFLKRIVGA